MATERILRTEMRKANKRHVCQCGEAFGAGTRYTLTTGIRSTGLFFRIKDADHQHKGQQMPLFVAKEPILQADPASAKPPKEMA